MALQVLSSDFDDVEPFQFFRGFHSLCLNDYAKLATPGKKWNGHTRRGWWISFQSLVTRLYPIIVVGPGIGYAPIPPVYHHLPRSLCHNSGAHHPVSRHTEKISTNKMLLVTSRIVCNIKSPFPLCLLLKIVLNPTLTQPTGFCRTSWLLGAISRRVQT